jgi:GNAT superfamily N-acetyltransferase
VRLRGGDLSQWRREAELVYGLINRALAHLDNFIPWPEAALYRTFESFLDIADPELILFAEAEGELVGWLPGVPNMNEVLIHANGLRRPWDYARAWWHSRRQPQCLAIKSVLVLREYWDIGVPAMLFAEMAKRASAKGYLWADNSLTAADNPTTPLLADHMGAKLYKRYRVYERLIGS